MACKLVLSIHSYLYFFLIKVYKTDLFFFLANTADNASNYSSGRAAASLTSTSLMPETKSERAMFDEEECKSKFFFIIIIYFIGGAD